MFLLGLIIITSSIILLFYSHHQIESDNFFQDIPPLFVIGVYYWGQGIVLAPFWFMVGLLTMFFMRPIDLLKLYFIFHIFRSLYEIWFWNQKEHHHIKKPPLLHLLTHFESGEEVMLYQLSHLVLVISFAFLLNALNN